MQDTVQTILKFWFEEVGPRQWDQVNKAFDFEVKERFELTYELAQDGLCEDWLKTPSGTLAYILLMGVFPHKMYRGEHRAYECSEYTIAACKSGLKKGFDQILNTEKKRYFYGPLIHSNELSDLELAVNLHATIAKDDPVSYNRSYKALNELNDCKSACEENLQYV